MSIIARFTELLDRVGQVFVPALLDAAVKGAVVIAAAWVVVIVMRRSSSAAARHFVWLLAVGSLLVLPMLSAALPAWRVLPEWAAARDYAEAVVNEPRRVQPMTLVESTSSPGLPETTVFDPPADGKAAPIPTVPSPSRPGITDAWAAGPLADAAADTAPLAVPVPAAPPAPPAAPDVRMSLAASLLLAWLVGVAVAGLPLVVSAIVLWHVGRASAPLTDPVWDDLLVSCSRELRLQRRAALRLGGERAMPMTWGSFRPKVVLPAGCGDWPAQRRRAVLAHELAHVKQWDCLRQLLVHLVCAAYWFHPLAWAARSKARDESEQACDDLVLSCGTRQTDYAEQVLHVASSLRAIRMTAAAAIAMARPSQLEGRLRAILDPNRNRQRLTCVRGALIALLLGAVVLPMAVLRAAPDPPASKTWTDLGAVRTDLAGEQVMAYAAELPAVAAAAPPATAPATAPAAAILPPLPEPVRDDRVALRVLGPAGQPLPIHDIASIHVFIQPDQRWLMGPKPQILQRFADGWVYVDATMFALAKPGHRTEMTFAPSPGAALTVSGEHKDRSRRVEYRSTAMPEDVGVDVSSGPADVAAGEVAGRAVDPAGRAVAGATVSFPRGTRNLSPIRPPATTDADGVFRFGDFANQRYVFMQVEKEGYAPRWITDVPIGSGFTVRLDDRTRLRGELALARDGAPAAGATLELVTSKPTTRPRMGNPIRNITLVAQADAQGRYDIAIEPGEYDVKISTPAGFTARHEKLRVAAGQAVALPRELTPGPRLRLRAIDSLTDRPVPGVQLYINEWRPGSISPRSGTERTTDEQGVTEWDKLIPGPTSISVRADGYTRWWLAEKGSRGNRAIDSLELNVRPGMEEVVVRMEPAMRVSGRVLSPDGEPVSGASVDVAGLETGDARYSKQSDAEGKFVVHFPNLDRVFASASRPARDYAIVAHDTRGRWANAVSEPFTAEPGQATDLTLRMTRGGRVRGRVVDPAGKPVAQIEVEAVARDGMDRAYYNPRALTDGDGRFDLGPMRGGDYTLQADTSFGVNIMYEPRQETRAITVKDGETVSAVQLIYQGPPPPPVPEWYYQTTGAPASRPAARQ